MRGLGSGETLALDDLLLVSERLKILRTARPNRKTGRISDSRGVEADGSADLSGAPSPGRRLLPARRREIRGAASASASSSWPTGSGSRSRIPRSCEPRCSRWPRKSASIGGISSGKFPCGNRPRSAVRAASGQIAGRLEANCGVKPTAASSLAMSEEKQFYRRRYGRKGMEFKAGFPVPEFVPASKFDIKHIAFLHAYCRLEPQQITVAVSEGLDLGRCPSGPWLTTSATRNQSTKKSSESLPSTAATVLRPPR